jgi:hypothetical protein
MVRAKPGYQAVCTYRCRIPDEWTVLVCRIGFYRGKSFNFEASLILDVPVLC